MEIEYVGAVLYKAALYAQHGKVSMRKVELLAPAGNYESFLGAVHAGADAVYLGGTKFGARAYADNFTQEEVCRAVRYAHIYGRKVYLTLNTLVKEREFQDIYPWLLPFYEAGLDGVIIQDLGVFQAVGEWFPLLSRHVSTQMTVTGFRGAEYLKAAGAKRIVPARELSLTEIREIKEKTDIEIETFIHGAICYCYSGQCLFSSMIGERSGNRGRCAQPCRLPYGMGKTGEKKYPLSLKDMCTIELLGQLIEAGIDSFKIEGRMKSPEYAAGVTAFYRKYIDRYYEDPSGYCVEKEDLKKLEALYIRSEISQGYYYRHNGRDMISLNNPGYRGSDEKLAEKIRKTWLESDFRLPIQADIRLVKGEKAALTVRYGDISASAKGDIVQEAHKRPLTGEGIEKQLGKCGNTAFHLSSLAIWMPEEIFLPVKALNNLRRMALEHLEEQIIRENGFHLSEERRVKESENPSKGVENDQKVPEKSSDRNGKDRDQVFCRQSGQPKLHVLALTKEQCGAAIACGVERLYVDADLCMDRTWLETLKNHGTKTEVYLALPYVIRQRDDSFLDRIEDLLKMSVFKGVLVRNLEEIQFLKDRFPAVKRVSDAGLYAWNGKALQVLEKDCKESYVPCELDIHELTELAEGAGGRALAISVYGRIPMMISANCAANTMEGCRRKVKKREQRTEFTVLTDRYGKEFPVYLNCIHCYNVIYNSIPLSLHQNVDRIKEAGLFVFRLDFTTESGDETEKIIRFWAGNGDRPYEEYTKGHFHRKAE